MDNEELSKQAKVFTEAFLIEFNVRVIAKNWYLRLLIKLRVLPAFTTFKIKPAYLVTMVQISDTILSIRKSSDHPDFRDRIHQVVSDNVHLAAKIIAYAVRNQIGEPPVSMVNQLKNGLEPHQLFDIYIKIIDAMDIKSFTNSIGSLTALNILSEPSRATQGEKIAPGESREPLESISA